MVQRLSHFFFLDLCRIGRQDLRIAWRTAHDRWSLWYLVRVHTASWLTVGRGRPWRAVRAHERALRRGAALAAGGRAAEQRLGAARAAYAQGRNHGGAIARRGRHHDVVSDHARRRLRPHHGAARLAAAAGTPARQASPQRNRRRGRV